MNRRLRRLKRELERRGAMVHVESDLPDEVAELFLREVLECPDCQAEARRAALLGDLPGSRLEH